MSQKPVILIIDDEKRVLEDAKNQLVNLFQDEYVVNCLQDPAKALEVFTQLIEQKIEVPVVICDQMMPGIKGDELLKLFHAVSADTRKILLTETQESEAFARFHNFPWLFRHISKPWAEGELLAVFREGIQSYYYNKTLAEQSAQIKELNTSLAALNQELDRRVSLMGKQIPEPFMEMFKALEQSPSAEEGGDTRITEKKVTGINVSIHDFVTINKDLGSKEQFRFLDEYLSQMGPVIQKHQGYIDKFGGGSIIALFLTPEEALRAAIELQESARLLDNRKDRIWPKPLDLRIGIDTDQATFGILGEREHQRITVFGKVLVVSKETMKKSRDFGAKIVVSQNTYDQLEERKRHKFRFLDLARVQGNELVLNFYEVLDALPQGLQKVGEQISDPYEKAVIDFRNGVLNEAERGFQECLAKWPDDTASQYFLSLCKKEAQTQLELSHEKGEVSAIPPLTTYLKFWGTRGSSPVSGREFARFGGCTSCLEIRNNDDLIIIDAGTGSRVLGEQLLKEKPRTIHMFVSHFHWDHISGFPFFLPIYQNSFDIHIYAPGDVESIRQRFSMMLNPHFFPVGLSDLQSKISFHALSFEESVQIGDITISSGPAFHPGTTFCFKIKTSTHTFSYVTDNEFLYGNLEKIAKIDLNDKIYAKYLPQIEFFKGCDVMIHEAQYLQKFYVNKVGWGHSSTENAALLMKIIKPKEWIVTHHDPDETDIDLVEKQKYLQSLVDEIGCNVSLAEDGSFRSL